MANQDQDMIDLHSARVAKLYHWMYILHAQTRKNIMHLESLQSITQPLTKWFTDLITKPFFPAEDTARFRETVNGVPNLLESIGDAARRQYLGKVIKAFGEMMGSDLSYDQGDKIEQEAKRLEQDSGIMIAAASSGVTFKKEEGGEASDQREQILSKRDEGFKKELVGGTGKKCSMECIKEKESKESDKEFGILNVIKVQANEVGIMLSRLIVDFMFLMSGKERWAEKIESFKSELKGVSIKNENSMVIIKIITLLEKARIDEPMKGKWDGLEQTELDESTRKESLNRRSPIDELFDKYLEKALDLLQPQFIEISLRLESIMSHPFLPESQNLMNVALSKFICDLKKYEEKLKGIREDINKLKVMVSFKQEHKDEKMTETWIFVESMIAELWNQSEYSYKE